ncbi:MAG: TraR/DksA family transcriptional regulator [Desulforhopalus sp.]
MDILDRAKELEEEQLARSLAFRIDVPLGPDRECCIECDEPIPLKRREALPGCQLCVDCQEELEVRQRNGNF